MEHTELTKGFVGIWKITEVDADSIMTKYDNHYGIIHRSDLSYIRIDEDLRQRFRPGQSIKAVVLDVPIDAPKKLGVKQLDDPVWNNFIQERQIYDEVYGRVVRILENEGAVIQIENTDGVVGIISPTEKVDVGRNDTYLLCGDSVKASIIGFDHNRRCAILSIIRSMQSTNSKRHSPEVFGSLVKEEFQLLSFRMGLFGQHTYNSAIQKLKAFGIQTIFFCDDSDIVSESYKRAFESMGFEVIVAIGGDEGIKLVNSSDFDLAIIDLDMSITDGCQVAEKIQSIKPDVKIIMVTGINDFKKAGYDNNLQRLNLVNTLIRKPLSIDDIANKLEDIQNGVEININDSDEFIKFISDKIKETFNLNDALNRISSNIRERMDADAVCIFRSNVFDPRIEIVSVSGNFPNDFDESLLNRSPVKDIIVEKRNLDGFNIPEDVNLPGNYYKNLYLVYPCKTVMARFLKVSEDYGYALFVMSKRIRDDWHSLRANVSVYAELITTTIERKLIEDRFISQQGFNIIGRISSSLIHELKNAELSVSNVITELDSLKSKVNSEDEGITYNDERFKAKFHEATDRLVEYNESVIQIQKVFLTLLRQHEYETVDINNHLALLCKTLERFAKDKNVKLVYHYNSIGETREDLNLAYLDQILINVIVNAIEQTCRIRQSDGLVDVSCELKHGDKYPIKIWIDDNGPGIHEVHRKKIFDLFFTTKSDGLGLGLYISRALAIAINANLNIEYTCRFDGTTFLIELPLKE
jgi:signal transduction histidine kinase/ActR/RegA family two-component response regulator/predicted RNA-binding protein with RPS1 domain